MIMRAGQKIKCTKCSQLVVIVSRHPKGGEKMLVYADHFYRNRWCNMSGRVV